MDSAHLPDLIAIYFFLAIKLLVLIFIFFLSRCPVLPIHLVGEQKLFP